MENNIKTPFEITAQSDYEKFRSRRLAELAKMPPHKDYTPIEGMFIPYGDATVVRECSQEEYKTKGGIIMGAGDHIEHCKIGWVVSIGDGVQMPLKEGDTIAFDRSCSFGFNYDGINYLRVPSFQIFFRVPPKTYLEPHYKDFFEKRRESRLQGQKNVEKRDKDKLEEKFEKRDESNRKKDYIEGKPSDNKTIIK